MPKLKRINPDDNSSQSYSFNKYILFQEPQTNLPSPIPDQDTQQIQKKNHLSSKKKKKQLSKPLISSIYQYSSIESITNDNIENRQATSQSQNKHRQNSIHKSALKPKNERSKNQTKNERSKSQRKSKTTKNINKQIQIEGISKTAKEQSFHFENQLKQKNHGMDHSELSKSFQSAPKTKFLQELNFRKTETDFQSINQILSKYREDEEESLNFGSVSKNDQYKSDLSEVDCLDKKKKRKEKKEKQLKVKNKLFSDLNFASEPLEGNAETKQIPQIEQQLNIERKQRRSIYQHAEQLEKKTNQAMDKRKFKTLQNGPKIKSMIKSTMNQIKDAEQIEVNVVLPNIYTKSTVTGALIIKNIILNQQKIAKKQAKETSSITNDQYNQNIQQKNLSAGSINLEKIEKQKGQIDFQHQEYKILQKKNRIKRQEYYRKFDKELQQKKVTMINSQQVSDNVKSTSLDDKDFGQDLIDDLRSNCSSDSRSNSRNKNRFERRDSFESQKSIFSQFNHQKKSNNETQSETVKQILSLQQLNRFTLANTVVEDRNDKTVRIVADQPEDHSKQFMTNRTSKHYMPISNPPITETKQSEGSSNISQVLKNKKSLNLNLVIINQSRAFDQLSKKIKSSLDDNLIQQKVRETLQQTYRLVDSQNQQNHQLEKNNLTGVSSSRKTLFQQEKSQDKIYQKIKDKINSGISLQEQLKNQLLAQSINASIKKHKRSQKSKKKFKNCKLSDGIQNFFEQEAQYSSSQQGHTDEQQQEYDQNELKDFIASEYEQINSIHQKFARKKFIKDLELQEQQAIQKIFKGLCGSKKKGETDSQKRRKLRMSEAAKKNKLQDLKDQCIDVNRQPDIVKNQSLLKQTEQEQKQGQKFQAFIDELNGTNKSQYTLHSARLSQINNNFILADLPQPANRKIVAFNQLPSLRIKGQAAKHESSQKNRKQFFQSKVCKPQKKIYYKIKNENSKRGDCTENKNKLQKVEKIQLGIKNSYNLDDENSAEPVI